MIRNALHFTDLQLRRAPGCANGWQLHNLSPGINIVVGPNASGKTTTARAFTAMLWPEKAPVHSEIAGTFAFDGAIWTAELHGPHALFQRNRQPQGRPQLPAAATLFSRCHIALHDLLQDGEETIAHAILLEASGKCDLDAAERELGFTENPKLRRDLRSEFQSAQQDLKSIQRGLDALDDESAHLRGLETRLREAREAKKRSELLAEARQQHNRIEAYAAAATTTGRFDSRLERLVGNELTLLEEKRRALQALGEKREEVKQAIVEARSQIAGYRLPAEGVPATLLLTQRTRLEELRAVAVEIERLSAERASAAAGEQQALLSLGANGDTAVAELPGLNTLASFVREWEDGLADQAVLQRWRDWLGEHAEPVNTEELRDAETILAQWLKMPASASVPQWLRPALIAMAALLAIGSAALALSGVPSAWVGVAFALALAAIALALRNPAIISPAALFPASSRVAPPRTWEPGGVKERLDEIREDLARAKFTDARRREREATEPEWDRVTARHTELEQQRRKLGSQLGCEIDPHLFKDFVQNVTALREARVALARLDAELAERKTQNTVLLTAIAEAWAPFGEGRPTDYAEARGLVEDLSAREQARSSAHQELAAREREYTQFGEQLERTEREIAEIFSRASVADAATLAALLEDFTAFKVARDQEKAQRGLREEAAAFFRKHPELEKRTLSDIEREYDEAAMLAEKVESLVADKSALETRIDAATRRTELQDAAARRDTARRALLDDREGKLSALAGHLVTEYLRKEMGELAMPPVFENARELFARFTARRWELVPPGGDGSFRARDTTAGGASRGLEELSSGTRVQLLLAVRAAFVTAEEQAFHVQLPLFLDETLANSDDQRAQQIIDAIAELTRGGRQIFYFTAQGDEVAKWRAFFRDHPDVPHHFVDLAAARGETAMPDFDRIAAPRAITAPEPGPLSYADYGRLLGVPVFDPRAALGGVHLWHVCEDTATLFRLLSLGFEYWGQLDDAFRHGEDKNFEDFDPARLRANAQLLEELARYWRFGRGRPLDHASLREGGVTDRFIDEIWKLGEECQRDGERLIEKLEQRAVNGFGPAKASQLRVYLEEKGFMSRDQPLDAATIRARLLPLSLRLGVESARFEALLEKIYQAG